MGLGDMGDGDSGITSCCFDTVDVSLRVDDEGYQTPSCTR
jgi:hypothetical protein